MIAGRELDALVAEKVMGWRRCDDPAHHQPCSFWFDESNQGSTTPEFSAEIADAWLVVEKLKANGNNVWVEWAGTVWVCGTTSVFPDIEADTAPLAICLAALKAVGVEMEKS